MNDKLDILEEMYTGTLEVLESQLDEINPFADKWSYDRMEDKIEFYESVIRDIQKLKGMVQDG